MATITNTISDLATAIERLNQFHQANLIKPSDLAKSPTDPHHFFVQGMLALKEDTRLQSIIEKCQLSQSLLLKLQSVFQRYTDSLNAVFNRNFVHHSSLITAVDPIASGSKDGVLTHNRAGGLRCITGGGLVDSQETITEAAFREFHEETGGGCQLTDAKPIMVVDSVRSARPYFLSVVFRGSYAGTPIENHEGKDFKEITLDETENHAWFTDHKSIVREVLKPSSSSSDRGIRYTSATPLPGASHLPSKPFKDVLTNKEDIEYTAALINEVDALYTELKNRLKREVFDCMDIEALERSQNAIGHGWEKKQLEEITSEIRDLRLKWNDDSKLWEYLGPVKLAAIEISKLFGTFINTGEGGVVEAVGLYRNKEQIFLSWNHEGKFVLEHAPLTQYRDFNATLRHHASQNLIQLQEPPILAKIYDPPFYKNAEGIRNRAFEFVINVPNGEKPMFTIPCSIREAENFPIDAWASKHDHDMFHDLVKFLKEK